jgi:hypothetical protein
VLGDIFSDAYYVLYDYSTRQVGFNGYVIAGLPEIDSGKKRGGFGILEFLLVILGIALVGIVGSLLYFLKKKRDDELRRELGDMYSQTDGEDGEKQSDQVENLVSVDNGKKMKRNKDEIDLDDY